MFNKFFFLVNKCLTSCMQVIVNILKSIINHTSCASDDVWGVGVVVGSGFVVVLASELGAGGE